jgi:hypothetical protein
MSAISSRFQPLTAETPSQDARKTMISETESYLDEHLHDNEISWPRRWDAPARSRVRKPDASRIPDHPRPIDSGHNSPEPATLVEIHADDEGQVCGEFLDETRKRLAAEIQDPQRRDVVIDLSHVQSLTVPLVFTLLRFAFKLRLGRRDVVLFGAPPDSSRQMSLLAFPGAIYFRLKPGEGLHYDDERLASPSIRGDLNSGAGPTVSVVVAK